MSRRRSRLARPRSQGQLRREWRIGGEEADELVASRRRVGVPELGQLAHVGAVEQQVAEEVPLGALVIRASLLPNERVGAAAGYRRALRKRWA